MTLIELLIAYRDIVKESGREAGRKFLVNTCDSCLWDHIIHSISDDGQLIDAEGCVFNP